MAFCKSVLTDAIGAAPGRGFGIAPVPAQESFDSIQSALKRFECVAIRFEITESVGATAIRAGPSKEEITKMLVDEFGWNPQGLTIRNSLDGMMAELK